MTTRAAQLAPAAEGVSWAWLQTAIEMAALNGMVSLPRVATRTPALAPHSVTTARTFTLRTMSRWGAMDRGYDAAAVVSELLTNALRHALPVEELTASGSPLRLGLLHVGHYVLCAVADPSSQAPILREPDWLDENGRGLQLVASLSDDWGFCATPDQPGKIVWATFATAGASGIQ